MSGERHPDALGEKVGRAIGLVLALVGAAALLWFGLGLIPDRWVTVLAVGRWPISLRSRSVLMILLTYLLLRRERK